MKKLTVPENISLKKEILRGLGKRETVRLLLACLPALAGVILFWCVNGSPGPRLLALMGLMIYCAICYAVFSTPEGNQSIYAYILQWVRFLRAQKFYRYHQEKEELYLADEKEND